VALLKTLPTYVVSPPFLNTTCFDIREPSHKGSFEALVLFWFFPPHVTLSPGTFFFRTPHRAKLVVVSCFLPWLYLSLFSAIRFFFLDLSTGSMSSWDTRLISPSLLSLGGHQSSWIVPVGSFRHSKFSFSSVTFFFYPKRASLRHFLYVRR